MSIPCQPASLPVNSACAVYHFAPEFRDWIESTDSCGNTTYMIGFGATATGPFPATDCPNIVINTGFDNIIRQVDNCGNPVALIGFDGSPTYPEACADLGTVVG